MEGIDFADLTDDQLVGLLRAVLRECVERGGAVQAAGQSAVLDEHEKTQIQREAADREAMKLRAQERERVAREAAEAVRRQRDAQEAAAKAAESAKRRQQDAETARAAGQEAVRLATEKEERQRSWLRRAASLVGLCPSDITLVCLRDNYSNGNSSKTRVLINSGGDARYSRDHLVDYSGESNTISTKKSLIGKKRELLAFCAELAATPQGVLCGAEFSWEAEPCQTT